MNAPGHVTLGLVAGGLGLWVLNSAGVGFDAGAAALGMAAAAVGALGPDIDHPSSTVGRRIPRTLLATGLGLLVFVAAVVGAASWWGYPGASRALLRPLDALVRVAWLLVLVALALKVASLAATTAFKHRGATHTLLFAGLATVLALWASAASGVPGNCAILFGCGWLSHVAADAFTESGLPHPLWPLLGR